jgi:hypothetical protein
MGREVSGKVVRVLVDGSDPILVIGNDKVKLSNLRLVR